MNISLPKLVRRFVNDRRLRVSGRRNMADSLFATGIPFLGHGDAAEHTKFGKNFKRLWLSVLVSGGLDQPRLIWPMLPLAAMMDFGNVVSIHGISPQVSCWFAKLAVLFLILPRVIAPFIAAMLSHQSVNPRRIAKMLNATTADHA